MPKVNEIAKSIDGQIIRGTGSREINNPSSLFNKDINEFSITWCSNKYINEIYGLKCGTVIINNNINFMKRINDISENVTVIAVKNPRLAFAEVLRKYFLKTIKYIQEDKIKYECQIGENVCICKGVILDKECIIGNNVRIGYNTVILGNTIIKEDVQIGCNCSIGNNGFGFERNDLYIPIEMPHLGGVLIESGVRIGNNCTIDRAVLGMTIIGKNTKIDNLVHIGHGAEIGENNLIITQTAIGGSAKIGNNCWISPSVSIMNKIEIGNDVFIGIGSIVIKSVKSGERIFGVPAKKIVF